MLRKLYLLTIFLLFSFFSIHAKSFLVRDVSQFNEKVKIAQPGDSLILANGSWQDARLIFKGKGEKDKYLYLTAETFGKVTLEGQSCLRLSGEWLHVSGLVFVHGHTPREAVVDFRTSSKDYAYHSVLSECVIDKYNQPSKDSADHWVDIWGKNNTVEYCYLGGKANDGTTLVIWPNDSNCIHNNHLIYRNYFGPRPRLGSNGGETIRIGTSQVCTNSSGSIVDGNYFEHCNGETEIISNKSCDNVFVNNTFYESEGSLVLRHGNRAIVSGNWFIGNGKDFTGGIRVINEGHQIYNNFFYKLGGEDFRSALSVMNGIPDSPANGYAPVKNVIVANNTYYGCRTNWSFCIGAGERNRTVTPQDVLILNNIVYSPGQHELIRRYDKTDGIKLENNLMVNDQGVVKENGTADGEILPEKVYGMDVALSSLKSRKLPFVKYDIQGVLRNEPVIGAFQNLQEKGKVERATSLNCGPEWYKPGTLSGVKVQGKVLSVPPGTDLIYQAVRKANAGDVLVLEAGEHLFTRKIVLTRNLTIRAAENAAVKPILKWKGDRENGSLFELEGDACLRVSGLAIDGASESKFPAKYAFTSSKTNALGYCLFINGCDIYHFKVSSGAILKGYKGTMADTLKITNSVLHDSNRAISLGDEKDDVGKYSAEYVGLENTVFHHFSQYILDYYRGGVDESTLGGCLTVNHCVFDAVATDADQSIFRLTGIVHVSIQNSIFGNSTAKTLVRLSGNKNVISHCCINNCVKPKAENGAKSENLLFVSPGFQKNSYHLSARSPLLSKASDGGSIGLR